MFRSKAFVRIRLAFLCMAGLATLASCGGGNNETPAGHDPVELALVRVEPSDGASDVVRNRAVVLYFNTIVLPSSVHDQSIRVRTGGTFQTRPIGTFLISGNIVEFNPTVTDAGGSNSAGFPAGAQILVEVPLKVAGDGVPGNNFLQNVEGNPITVASGDNRIAFTTGIGWSDPVPGPPGVLGLEFIPAPNPFGQVRSDASVTMLFSEPVDPGSLFLGKNVYLTNNSPTSSLFQEDIPSVVYFDGSLTRFTFVPVFGFGQGPFNILVNFIDPDDPGTFNPELLPTDLGGIGVQNFTFHQTFDTMFDATTLNTGLIREDFTTAVFRDPQNTDALWGDDTEIPFAVVGKPITTRVVDVNITDVLMNPSATGGVTFIDNSPFHTTTRPHPPNGEEDFCPTFNPLVGPELAAAANLPNWVPATALGRRQLNLYRQTELGSKGTVIRAAWGPDSDATFASSYDDVSVRLGHHVRGTSLAAGSLFDQFDVDNFVTVAGPLTYRVPQRQDVNGDGVLYNGYLDWPEFDTFFEFNGSDDIILDVEAREGTTWQQFRTFLAIDWIGPGVCSCVNFGGCRANNTIGLRQMDSVHGGDLPVPASSAATGVMNPGPWVNVMQFELAQLRSDARSRWYDTGVAGPDFLPPIIQPLVQPGGSSIAFAWSASMDGVIEDVPFSPDINDCDGFRYIRFHGVLRSNLFTKSRARVQIVEVPFTYE